MRLKTGGIKIMTLKYRTLVFLHSTAMKYDILMYFRSIKHNDSVLALYYAKKIKSHKIMLEKLPDMLLK